MTYRNPDLLRLARKAPRCMACNRPNDGTVVAAHSNERKGMGLKAPDHMWAAMCGKCHIRLDQGADLSREDRRAMWLRAYWFTQDWLWEVGLLVVASEPVPHTNPERAPSRKIKSAKAIPSRPMQKSTRKIPSRPFR